ncbi:MAG: hypothetical protein KAS47_01105 [Candidatus Heimdallarchaeota archaeon]|nr:hypothetical protein [Candidatus Heimdallarchaeota archaeon]MCK4973457.1 hypothetical protein [Candidatus Heimdallarchaeota archaeon]
MSNNDSSFQDFSSERIYLRKKPYCEINLSELSKPGKYRIVGTVTSVTDDAFIINDGSNQIEAILTTPQNLEVKEGILLRLFGFIEIEPKKQMKVSIIQDLSAVDIDTYDQIKELEQSLIK